MTQFSPDNRRLFHVEHPQSRKMSIILGSMLLLALVCSGCSRPNPNPELQDKIYLDLKARAKKVDGDFASETKHLETLRTELAKSQPNTTQRKIIQNDISTAIGKITKYKQLAEYLKIRTERRLIDDQVNYKEAFAKSQAWPDPKEYQEYLVHKRLRETNLDWNTHVPHLKQTSMLTSEKNSEKGKKEADKKSEEHKE